MNPLLPGQPLKVIGPEYQMQGLMRELLWIHSRINSIIQAPVLTAPTPLPDAKGLNPALNPPPFTAANVATAAEVAAALNLLSAAINANTLAVTGLLAVFNSVPN